MLHFLCLYRCLCQIELYSRVGKIFPLFCTGPGIRVSHFEARLYPVWGTFVPCPYLVGMSFVQIRMDFPFLEAEKIAVVDHSAVVLGVCPSKTSYLLAIFLFRKILFCYVVRVTFFKVCGIAFFKGPSLF